MNTTSHKMGRSVWAVILTAATFVGGISLLMYANRDAEAVAYFSQRLFCLDQSAFPQSKVLADKSNVVNRDGTIRYFYDDFTAYDGASVRIDDFDDLSQIKISGPINSFATNDLHIDGKKSLEVTISNTSKTDSRYVEVTKTFLKPLNLKEWEGQGDFTLWMNTPDEHTVESAYIEFVDASGDIRTFKPLVNLQSNTPNFYEKDDAYPDIQFKHQADAADEWTDYQIVGGWNFLFWENEPESFSNNGLFNPSDIRAMKLVITISPSAGGKIYLDDFRLVSGLQKDDNVLSPNWFPPHGRPQYGIFDLDHDGVKLINVRQTQYPSNGDHARMITKGLTPENFAMRVRFEAEDVGADSGLENTWFRLAYDFDPEWDPGHDWFGFYSSLEWGQAGLISVIPVERFYLQDQEPKKELISESSTAFKMRDDTTYEVQMEVHGQQTTAWVYTVGDGCLTLKEKVSYEFQRERYTDKRYPIAIEATGNMKIRLYEVEVVEI